MRVRGTSRRLLGLTGGLAGTLLALALTFTASSVEAGGARILERSASDIRQRGWVYAIELPAPDEASASETLTTLYWQFELKGPSVSPEIVLCAPARCISLDTLRGHTEAFRGLAADTPLELRYALPGEGMLRQPVRAGRFQLILNYRRGAPEA